MIRSDSMRDSICAAVSTALQPRLEVLAGWEGGSAAFGAVDTYSDIDLHFLVTDDVSLDELYGVAEEALNRISPIAISHNSPPGRYYKLRDGNEFLLIDLCFVRVASPDHFLDVDRHGIACRLFDKAEWLSAKAVVPDQTLAQQRRYSDLKGWFPESQSFVRKELLRRHQADAMAAFWVYTIRPLADLLRMRYCPARWDFGMRYLERDLPAAVYARFCKLLFIPDLADLEHRFGEGREWGVALIAELAPSFEQSVEPNRSLSK
jgi:hypothetical protein